MDQRRPETPSSSAGGRRERIERLLEADPSDVFLRYALALEWVSQGDLGRGLEMLSALAAAPLEYVPAFHMAGRHLAAAGRIEEARSVLRDGIEAAREQGESHAAAEMAELLVSLGDHGESG
jgi:tetratricopeptide (TPR) repeat protein